MKITQRNGKAAFTLVELLAVITIIAILAGLVVGGTGFVTERQAKEKARVQIALLSKALEEYKLDMGNYPLTANTATGTGTSASSLYIPLFYEGYDYAKQNSPAVWTKKVNGVDFPKATKIYLPDLDPSSTKQGWVTLVTGATGIPPATTTVKDPWGKEYCYRSAAPLTGTEPNAATQNPDFDIWSWGKDGVSDPVAKAKDDIRNF